MIHSLIHNFKELVKGLLLGMLFLCSIIYHDTLSNEFYKKYPTPFELYHTLGSKYYHLELTNKIQENTEAYADLANKIRGLGEDDILILHIHNYGGSVSSEQLLVNALVETKAKVIANVDGPAYSAAAVITCAADEIRMGKYSYLMFHNARFGSTVVSNPLRSNINRSLQECVKHGILTQDDINHLNTATTDLEIYYPATPVTSPLPDGPK